MTEQEAKSMVSKARLTPAAHDDLPQVKRIMTKNPELVDAMNTLRRDTGAETPMAAAAHMRSTDILRYFVSQGVEVDIVMACALDDADCIARILAESPEQVHRCGSHGIPLLLHVGTVQTAEILLNAGADVNSVKEKRRGPLHHAAHLGSLELSAFLISRGASISQLGIGSDFDDQTPLAIAECRGHHHIADYLRARGATI